MNDFSLKNGYNNKPRYYQFSSDGHEPRALYKLIIHLRLSPVRVAGFPHRVSIVATDYAVRDLCEEAGIGGRVC